MTESHGGSFDFSVEVDQLEHSAPMRTLPATFQARQATPTFKAALYINAVLTGLIPPRVAAPEGHGRTGGVLERLDIPPLHRGSRARDGVSFDPDPDSGALLRLAVEANGRFTRADHLVVGAVLLPLPAVLLLHPTAGCALGGGSRGTLHPPPHYPPAAAHRQFRPPLLCAIHASPLRHLLLDPMVRDGVALTPGAAELARLLAWAKSEVDSGRLLPDDLPAVRE
eukprot:CAMPEP_0180127500 /NCGR_PEP_ID=MMETSP0986-20121125/6260_1 /TAXON_ID=697907 /ORGANISM="non described non described, Strain CCMP2293" /LENGTH=224 /DNA_ID=CAMNT_0022066995 /DNA_START=110 /DNA_END=783 /DNA_ORIENTATION=+